MLLVLLVGLAVCCRALVTPAATHSPGKVLAGYVFPQDSLLKPGQIDARRLTRINYAFANIQDGRLVEGYPTDTANLATLFALRRVNPSLTVLISVGGWGWSGGFSDMALAARSRARFIESATAFVRQHHLDGVDIDWEYPGLPGAAHRFRPEDKHNYTLLLKELRRALDSESKMLHRRLYLTVAAGGSSEFLEHTEMGEVAKSVDRVNLMAYDYYIPGSGGRTGNHAPLFTDPADPKQVSANASVLAMEQAGVPAEKIVLGVPFYGHVWRDVPDRNHGLFQRGKAGPEAYAQAGAIESEIAQGGYTRYWDAASQAPYLYNAGQGIFISYSDAESLRAKCAYVKAKGLGGVMFWDYAGDPSGKLLGVLDAAMGSAAGPGVAAGTYGNVPRGTF